MPDSKFKPNDLVVMENAAHSYGGWFSFFKDNDLPINLAARFDYYGQPRFEHIYRVVFVGKKKAGEDTVYCIESADMSRIVYLVNDKAIKKVGIADMEIFDESIGDVNKAACFGFGG